MGAGPSFPVLPLSRDRTFIVTGGNLGIGYEVAKWLAMMGATVVIGCRSEERARQAIEAMNEEYQKLKLELKGKHSIPEYDSLAVEFMPLDLSSFQSTLDFVENFKKSGRQLHVLVCNAGIAMAPFEKTGDGYESMLQVNYLSHFLLTVKLLPVMRTSGEDCRILLVSSDAHRTCTFDIKTMNYEGRADKFGRLDYYGRSKLYQIMQMYSMARRLKGTNVSINSSHPGMVKTGVNRSHQDLFFWKTVFPTFASIFGQLKTPIEGATPIINGAVNPSLAGVSGMYFKGLADGYKTSVATNVDKQEALWKKTLEYLQFYITEEEMSCLEGHA